MLLKNCRIFNSREVIRGDILIEGGKIRKIGKNVRGDDVLDARGGVVIPGVVDMHVHMRDFEQRAKEDFLSGSSAALAGGVTTFIDMPNTKPPVTDARTFDRRIKLASRKSLADFGINFGITEENFEEASKVHPAMYKIYMDGTLGEVSDSTLTSAIQGFDSIAIHAELAGGSEEAAVKKVAKLAARLKRRVHICHISSEESLGYINDYTTCEATPHHLLLTERDAEKLKGIAKTSPPLRTRRDRDALWRAIKSGRVNVISSDHAPHRLSEKMCDDAPPGVPGIEIMLRLLLTQVDRGILTMHTLVRLLCEAPSDILGIEKGYIQPGRDADILLVDLAKERKVKPDEFYSKAKYSPFEGAKTTGDVDKVILRGEITFENGEVTVKRGYGRRVR